jgi:hypothetical protein
MRMVEPEADIGATSLGHNQAKMLDIDLESPRITWK